MKSLRRRRIRLESRQRRRVLSRLRRRGVDEDHAHLLMRIAEALEGLAARRGAPPGVRGIRADLIGLYELDEASMRDL